jgi:hypothetical protein
MENRPKERLEGFVHVLTNAGLDCFGLFASSSGDAQQIYEVYLSPAFFFRTIHFEVLNSMDTDSFVKALRRFISYRGCPKIIKDPNIVAGENKLALGIGNLNSTPTVGEMAAVTVPAAGPL